MLEAAPRSDLGQSRSQESRDFIGYSDIAGFIRRNFKIISLSMLAGLTGAALYLATTEAAFTARAELLIDPKVSPALREQTGDVSYSLDSAQVESQMAVLRSEKIALMVINHLGLAEDPEFQGGAKARAEEAPRWPSRVLPDWITRFLFRKEEVRELSEGERIHLARAIFDKALTVRRVGFSYAIEISFTSKDPDKAAQIGNAIADAYVREQLEAKSVAARQSSRWLEARIAELRAQMNDATHRAQEFRARHDYRIGKRREEIAAGAQTPVGNGVDAQREAYTLEELETTAETFRKMYESFLQAFTASVHRQSYPVSDARVITEASRPSGKSHPRTKLVLALGPVIGAMAGLGVAIVRQGLDRSVRSARQLRGELDLECLGELPRKNNVRPDEVLRNPFSPFSNAVKSVKTAITIANRTQSIRCFGVTSATTREGKTTLVSNLASLFTVSGIRTLVIDADVCKARLSEVLAPKPHAGLIHALREPESVRNCIVPGTLGTPLGSHAIGRADEKSVAATFDLLPGAGQIATASELLGSPRMQALLDVLLQSYDIVIVDLPPVTQVADVLAISSIVDELILVVEWGGTPIETVADVSRLLQAAGGSVLGAVMTKVAEKSSGLYGMPGEGTSKRWRPVFQAMSLRRRAEEHG